MARERFLGILALGTTVATVLTGCTSGNEGKSPVTTSASASGYSESAGPSSSQSSPDDDQVLKKLRDSCKEIAVGTNPGKCTPTRFQTAQQAGDRSIVGRMVTGDPVSVTIPGGSKDYPIYAQVYDCPWPEQVKKSGIVFGPKEKIEACALTIRIGVPQQGEKISPQN
jgi:hypothetical protein